MRHIARGVEFLAWAHRVFGECALRREERALRLLEETMELAQAAGIQIEQATRTARRVWGRPPGGISKEVGQVQSTMDTFCANEGLDPQALAEDEFARCQEKSDAHWKERHDAKTAVGITTDSR